MTTFIAACVTTLALLVLGIAGGVFAFWVDDRLRDRGASAGLRLASLAFLAAVLPGWVAVGVALLVLPGGAL